MWVDCQVPGTSSGMCSCECKTAWQTPIELMTPQACPLHKNTLLATLPKAYASEIHRDITSQIICSNSRSLSILNSRCVQYMWSHANTSAVGQDHGCFSSIPHCSTLQRELVIFLVVKIWLYFIMKHMETCKSSMQVTSSVHRTCLDSLNGIDLPHQIIFSWPRALVSNMNRCFQEPQHVQRCSEI